MKPKLLRLASLMSLAVIFSSCTGRIDVGFNNRNYQSVTPNINVMFHLEVWEMNGTQYGAVVTAQDEDFSPELGAPSETKIILFNFDTGAVEEETKPLPFFPGSLDFVPDDSELLFLETIYSDNVFQEGKLHTWQFGKITISSRPFPHSDMKLSHDGLRLAAWGRTEEKSSLEHNSEKTLFLYSYPELAFIEALSINYSAGEMIEDVEWSTDGQTIFVQVFDSSRVNGTLITKNLNTLNEKVIGTSNYDFAWDSKYDLLVLSDIASIQVIQVSSGSVLETHVIEKLVSDLNIPTDISGTSSTKPVFFIASNIFGAEVGKIEFDVPP